MRRFPEYFWSESEVTRLRYIPMILLPSFVALSRVVFVVLMPSEMNLLFTEPEYLLVCLLTNRFTQIDELMPAPKPAVNHRNFFIINITLPISCIFLFIYQ